MKKGSFLDNKKMPKEGQTIYAIIGFDQKIVKGKIIKMNNIDKKGLANTYLDIDVNGKIYHTDISQTYDHKPKKIKVKDEYGETMVWENDILDRIDLMLTEIKFKKVIRKGKLIKKPICPDGFKASGGRCVKISAAERRKRSKSARRAQKKIAASGVGSRAIRKRAKAMRKRQALIPSTQPPNLEELK